ncbi:MAG TPA: hypothetical protein VFE50_02950 [Cyclobacteriaceae bacterium]|nr:hypothetical protein [Cyclobacteriaceae bacterium]
MVHIWVMEEQALVKNILLKIFRQNGFHDPLKMVQRDFEYVSSEIQSKTGIVLSSITIKRLANGEFSRLPQVATLNAIARYLGYSNWQELKNSEETPVPDVRPRRKSWLQVAIAIVLVSAIAAVFFMSRSKTGVGNLDTVVFTAKKTTNNELPNTVVFNYNVDDVDADSFFIQQSWDDRKRIKVYKNHYTVTDIYYEPGYHVAKLIANDMMIKEIDVSIPTDRWVFYANEMKPRYKTAYINVEKFTTNGILGITKDDLLGNNIDIQQNMFYTYAYFPGKFDVSGDNFTLKARVRMKEVKNNLCPFIELEVFCQRYYQIIKSTERGCASEAFVVNGDKTVDGKTANLENITFKLSEWTDIELKVKDKKATISINGSDSFEASYEASTRNVTGLAFISNGLCEVDHVELTGLDGPVMRKDSFDE